MSAGSSFERFFAGFWLIQMGLAGTAQGQGAIVEVGHLFSDPGWTAYRVGYQASLLGPLGTTLYGTGIASQGPGGDLWGVGADLHLFQDGSPGPYLVGGLVGGVGTGSASDTWSSWSAGVGYEIRPVGFLSVAAEGRWRELSFGDRGGPQLALRLGASWGERRRPQPAASSGPIAGTSLATLGELPGASRENRTIGNAVVRTATEAMGTPYKWGGTDQQEGFDCSGLIQYAYGKHGIVLPRRSAEQAGYGRAVARAVDSLAPGDILTFSSGGKGITHVGLYVGGGQFIHSSTRGVQLSVLSGDDPYGRWWWRRWVGARRVIDER